MEQYHRLSDDTMDALLEDLEQLVEDHGDPSFEVEYHVCFYALLLPGSSEAIHVERSAHPQTGRIWNLCYQ